MTEARRKMRRWSPRAYMAIHLRSEALAQRLYGTLTPTQEAQCEAWAEAHRDAMIQMVVRAVSTRLPTVTLDALLDTLTDEERTRLDHWLAQQPPNQTFSVDDLLRALNGPP